MRLVIPVPTSPHLVIGTILPVFPKKHILFEVLGVSISEYNIPEP